MFIQRGGEASLSKLLLVIAAVLAGMYLLAAMPVEPVTW